MKRKYWKYELVRWIGVIVAAVGFVIVIGSESIVDNRIFYPTVAAGTLMMSVGILSYKLSKYMELFKREQLRRRKRIIRLVVMLHEQRQ